MTKLLHLLHCVMLALACFVASSTAEAVDRPPNVLLVCVDDLRPELGCYEVSYPNTDEAYANDVRKHYAACVAYADAQFGRLMTQLQQVGIAESTIIALWGDHGWHLGEHALWGKHTLFEESLRSPLIVSYPGITRPGDSTDAVVETVDAFPTLCDLAGVPVPDFVHGVSLAPVLKAPDSLGHAAISYFKGARTIRTETHRLVLHADGYAELYDHTSAAGETENIAGDNVSLVQDLARQLHERLADACLAQEGATN